MGAGNRCPSISANPRETEVILQPDGENQGIGRWELVRQADFHR